MAIVPKKKTSKSRTNRRTTNWIKLSAKKLRDKVALNADKTWLSHFINENWIYKWNKIITKKLKKKNITRV